MKMEAKKPVIEIINDDESGDDDSFFFLAAAAAEADVLASKRRRITPPSSNTAAVPKPLAVDNKNTDNDGLYMAALKGDHSTVRPSTRSNYASGGGGGGGQFGNFRSGTDDPSIAEKSCPCGLGVCSVLTANTERNRGRKFYKCPLRQENGGCGFFEWCDSHSSAPGASNPVSMAGGGNHGTDGSSHPALDCPCGAGSCSIFTAKTGKNIGQQFYRCPSNQGSSCGFFKWCNESTQSPRVPISAPKAVYNSTDANNASYTARTGSSCFKCGKEGHWARDCSAQSSNPSPQIDGGRSASSGTCYKCGKPGHWSRDCT